MTYTSHPLVVIIQTGPVRIQDLKLKTKGGANTYEQSIISQLRCWQNRSHQKSCYRSC